MLSIGVSTLPPLMDIADVQRGQRGICLTVFEGTEVEEVPFFVKGVMHDYLGPDRDLVMIRLEGEKAEFTGVVAGMSGSPCSIDGKLVGALGYAFAAFAKEPIAGVTPIRDMLATAALPDSGRTWRSPKGSSATNRADDAKDAWAALRDGVAPQRAADKASLADGFRKIDTPLALGGVPPEMREHFRPWLESLGFSVMSGGNSVAGASEALSFEPGGAIAALLVDGDIRIAATGTVTTLVDGTLTAFGHPFTGAGKVSIPMAPAVILNTMASQQRSFKMSAPGPIQGELTQDRLPAIAGKVGVFAPMIPLRLRFSSAGQDHSHSLRIARDPALTPRFVAMGLASLLGNRITAGSRGTLRVQSTLKVANLPSVTLDRWYSAESNARMSVEPAIDIARVFSWLWSEAWGQPPAIELEIVAVWSDEPIGEFVDTVALDRSKARPGETVHGSVKLLGLQGAQRVVPFAVEIPRKFAGQRVDVVVGSSEGFDEIDGLLDGAPQIENREELVSWLNRQRESRALRVGMVVDGLRVGDSRRPLTRVPGTKGLMLSGQTSQLRRGALVYEDIIKRGIDIRGWSTISLDIAEY